MPSSICRSRKTATASMTTRTRTGRSSALGWVRVSTTTDSPSFSSFVRDGHGGESVTRRAHGGTTSPALDATDARDPSADSSTRPSVRVERRRPRDPSPARQVSPAAGRPGPRGRGWRSAPRYVVARRRRRARRARNASYSTRSRCEQRRPAGRCGRRRRPASASEVAVGDAAARRAVWSTLMPDPDHRRRARRRVDPLDEDPAPPCGRRASTSLGHFRRGVGARAAQRTATAYPVSSGSHGHSAPAARVDQQHREGQRRAGPASPRCGRAGRGPAVWCSATTTRPSRPPARARSATSALVERRRRRRTSTRAGDGAGEAAGVEGRACGRRRHHGH